MTKTQRPRIFQDGEAVDPLATFGAVPMRGGELRPGMVLLDPELRTPEYAVDHRVGRARDGQVEYLVEDLDRGGWLRLNLTANKLFSVAR